MPLQNRVNPMGDIIATSARGSLMGNRGGSMHNDNKELMSISKTSRWITCQLAFKGRKRELMSKGLYTELFFSMKLQHFLLGIDPVLSVEERYNEFKSAWVDANSDLQKEGFTSDK